MFFSSCYGAMGAGRLSGKSLDFGVKPTGIPLLTTFLTMSSLVFLIDKIRKKRLPHKIVVGIKWNNADKVPGA